MLGRYLAVEKVSLDVGSNLLLPPISIAQQFLFVIQQLLVTVHVVISEFLVTLDSAFC